MKHSLRSLEGYLIIDHRSAMGTPDVPEGRSFESATVTCSHCHRQVILNPLRTRERGYCPKCDHYVCESCEAIRVKTGECLPLNAVFDRLQNEAAKLIV